jgi:hypothetical protein
MGNEDILKEAIVDGLDNDKANKIGKVTAWQRLGAFRSGSWNVVAFDNDEVWQISIERIR